MPWVWLICPPTKRITPLPSDATIDPVPAFGLYTYSSMTMLLSRPTLSVDVSGKTTWVDPTDDVWMRSLCSTSVPITSVRDAAPGGVPVEAGLTAPTLPTFCCALGIRQRRDRRQQEGQQARQI